MFPTRRERRGKMDRLNKEEQELFLSGVKRLFRYDGWKQEDFADGIVTSSTLSKILNQRIGTTMETMEKMAEKLGREIGEIIADERGYRERLSSGVSSKAQGGSSSVAVGGHYTDNSNSTTTSPAPKSATHDYAHKLIDDLSEKEVLGVVSHILDLKMGKE
jgi:hypothetical protein